MIDLTLVLALLLGAVNDGTPADPQSGKQGKPAPTAAPAPAQDGERPAISASDLKLLRDSNIFSPRNRKRTYTSSPSRTSREAHVPPKPRPPVVTGIFYDAKAESFIVVVEDRNEASLKQFKEPKFLKAGDEVGGYKIGPVTAEKAVFLKGDLSKDLKVGESLPGPDGKPVSVAPAVAPEDPEAAAPPDSEEKVDIKPLDAESNSKALETLRSKVGKKNRPSKDE